MRLLFLVLTITMLLHKPNIATAQAYPYLPASYDIFGYLVDTTIQMATTRAPIPEVTCLAKNIYFEARGEPEMGQLAVALVTINRVNDGRFPSTICQVVWQQGIKRNGKRAAQFSWTLDGKSDNPTDGEWNIIFTKAMIVLSNSSQNNVYDFTRGSTHYHTNDVDPRWNREMLATISIGRHDFYKQPQR